MGVPDAEWLERTREWEKQEAILIQREKEQKHAAALAAVPHARKSALLKAANNWHQSRIAMEFIDACEARWKNEEPVWSPDSRTEVLVDLGERNRRRHISIFNGLPGPSNRPRFRPGSVPFGGPYPPTRAFS